ncbi:MAG: hypothetical protein KGJ60_14575, partial [Verrucomicrobiota bacterium]|nr:hypothetical protein [Verrucomicrobiota bacterium]
MKTTIGRNEEVSRKAVVLLARALVVVGFLFWAGGASATPWAVVERGANHNLWQRTTYETTPSGQTISHVHQYIQIETGLNHWQDNQWEPSLAQIDLLPDGTAAATNGQHQAYFPSDIAQGVIKLVTPEGKELQVQPLALSYFDGSNSVLIAELTNSVGELVASNQVLYRGALTGPDGFKVDLRYTYTKASFEQDVIIEDQPPDPASLGLNSNALLQVTTEFFNPPPPEVTQETVPTVVGNLTDDQLSFGVMTMGRGKAFLLGTNATPAGVEKQWFNLSGQQFFVEELPVAAIRNELDALPLTAWRNKTGRALYAVTKGMAMPPRPAAKTTNKTRFLAQATPPRQGFVLDYVAMSSQTNWTFQGNTTYYISGTVNLSGTNTFEGGAVLKYTNGASLNLSFGSVLDWRAASYRPIMFTSKDDNTEGESISGSTGNPTNYYASIALDFIVGAPITLSNVRIAYAQQAVAAYTTPLTLYDVQFLDCSNGLNLSYSSAYLRNALF